MRQNNEIATQEVLAPARAAGVSEAATMLGATEWMVRELIRKRSGGAFGAGAEQLTIASIECRTSLGSEAQDLGGLSQQLLRSATSPREVALRIQPASYQVLHRFGSGSDGAQPYAGLINVNGFLYGTTVYGGTYESGTVYRISTAGVANVLHSIAGGSDGATPVASILNGPNGLLYGTTLNGGGKGCYNHAGCGTVFAVAP